MVILELIIRTLLLTALLSALLIPIGQLLLQRYAVIEDKNIELAASLGISLLIYAVLPLPFLFFELPDVLCRAVLSAFALSSAVIWLHTGGYQSFRNTGLAPILGILSGYVALCTLCSAYPNGALQDISVHTDMALSSFAVDNLIPYNTARYLTEQIQMAEMPVVPDWSAADRGPLAGLFVASMFFMLGLRDFGVWEYASSGTFFVYHVILSFLNALALFAAVALMRSLFGKRSALIAILLVMSNFFFFINVLFSWPKLVLVYFLFLAFYLFLSKHVMLSGLFLAAALLAHDSAIFTIAAFFLLAVGQFLYYKTSEHLKAVVVTAAVLCAAYAPWKIYTGLFVPSDNRLLLLHVFAIEEHRVGTITVAEAAVEYIRNRDAAGMLFAVWDNLRYPFDLQFLYRHASHWMAYPRALIEEVCRLSMNKLPLSIGLWNFALLPFAFWWAYRTTSGMGRRLLCWLVAAGYLALPIASVVFGAHPNTITYVWGYPAFLATFLPLAVLLSRPSWLAATMLGLLLALNISYGVLHFYLSGTPPVMRYLSTELFACQTALALLLLATVFWMLRNEKRL